MKTLKEYRLKSKYSMQDMADYLKISKTFYWQIENNRRRLSYDMAYRIATKLKTKPDKLFYKDIKEIIKKH